MDHQALAAAQTQVTAKEIGAKDWPEVLHVRHRASRELVAAAQAGGVINPALPLLDIGQPRTNHHHHPTLDPPENADNDGESNSPTN